MHIIVHVKTLYRMSKGVKETDSVWVPLSINRFSIFNVIKGKRSIVEKSSKCVVAFATVSFFYICIQLFFIFLRFVFFFLSFFSCFRSVNRFDAVSLTLRIQFSREFIAQMDGIWNIATICSVYAFKNGRYILKVVLLNVSIHMPVSL